MSAVEPGADLVTAFVGGFHEASTNLTLDAIGVRDERLHGYRIDVWIRAEGEWMVSNPWETAGPFTVTGLEVTELCLNTQATDNTATCH